MAVEVAAASGVNQDLRVLDEELVPGAVDGGAALEGLTLQVGADAALAQWDVMNAMDGPDLLQTDEAGAADVQFSQEADMSGLGWSLNEALSAPATQMPNYVTQEELNAVVNSLNANIINTGNNLQANQMGLQEQIINLQKQIINLQK